MPRFTTEPALDLIRGFAPHTDSDRESAPPATGRNTNTQGDGPGYRDTTSSETVSHRGRSRFLHHRRKRHDGYEH